MTGAVTRKHFSSETLQQWFCRDLFLPFVSTVDFFFFHKPASFGADNLTINIWRTIPRAWLIYSKPYLLSQLPPSALNPWFMTFCRKLLSKRLSSFFMLRVSSRLSLFLSLTQPSNNIIPLGVDKCSCCDKELGEGNDAICLHLLLLATAVLIHWWIRNVSSIDVQNNPVGICDLQRMRRLIYRCWCCSFTYFLILMTKGLERMVML